MLGRWNPWLVGTSLDAPEAFGDLTTYQMGAEWLSSCSLVEDWGCGRGGFRPFVEPHRYRGVDGSKTPFASVIADLTTYRSDVSGIFMRHVLEHNDDWALIVDNAASSAQDRLFIAIFTPLASTTHRIAWTPDLAVPDISFRIQDLLNPISRAGFTSTHSTFPTATQYGVETVIRSRRSHA